MGLKNYTTKVDAKQTIMEIEALLVKFGASDIWKKYDGETVTALSFAINTEYGKMPFVLPLKISKIRQKLIVQANKGNIKLPKRLLQDDVHSINVGWRIIKDWIDAQLTLIELDQVEVEQVFLPYAYNPVTEMTFYETLRDRKFAGMLMEPKSE